MAWAPDYATVVEARDYLRIDDSLDDVHIARAISAASRAVDRACNRQFGRDATPTTRWYTARYTPAQRTWTVPVDDLMTDAGLAIQYGGQAVDQRRLFPINAVAEGRPWTSLQMTSGVGALAFGVSVTGTFGWTAVPAAVVQATLLQTSRFMSRRESPYGIAGSPDTGSEMRLLSRLDPDVEVSLAPYRRGWAVAV